MAYTAEETIYLQATTLGNQKAQLEIKVKVTPYNCEFEFTPLTPTATAVYEKDKVINVYELFKSKMTISSKDPALCPLNEFIIYNNDEPTRILSTTTLEAATLTMADSNKGVNKYTFRVGHDKNVAKSAQAVGELVICGGETLSFRPGEDQPEVYQLEPPAAGDPTTLVIRQAQYSRWFSSSEPKCGVESYALEE